MNSANPTDGGGRVDPSPKPTRRTFTTEYRDRIREEYLAAPHGEKGAVWGSKGLYQTQMREWAQAQADAGGIDALRPKGAVVQHYRGLGRCARSRQTDPRERPPGQASDTNGGRARDHGKTGRALGVHLREHGHAAATEQAMTAAFDQLRTAQLPVRRACALIGRARAPTTDTQKRPLKGPAGRVRLRTTVRHCPPPNAPRCSP